MKNVLIHVQLSDLVLKVLNAACWIQYLSGQWFVLVQLDGSLTPMVYVDHFHSKHQEYVRPTMIVPITNLVSIDFAVSLVVAALMPFVMSRTIVQSVHVKQAMKAIQMLLAIVLNVVATLSVLVTRLVSITTASILVYSQMSAVHVPNVMSPITLLNVDVDLVIMAMHFSAVK
jgi:hypothetical protein